MDNTANFRSHIPDMLTNGPFSKSCETCDGCLHVMVIGHPLVVEVGRTESRVKWCCPRTISVRSPPPTAFQVQTMLSFALLLSGGHSLAMDVGWTSKSDSSPERPSLCSSSVSTTLSTPLSELFARRIDAIERGWPPLSSAAAARASSIWCDLKTSYGIHDKDTGQRCT